jgi:hypothetical protein
MLLSFQEAYFLANLRGLPVSCSKRFVAETVSRAISHPGNRNAVIVSLTTMLAELPLFADTFGAI